jgi:hypothetical protein
LKSVLSEPTVTGDSRAAQGLANLLLTLLAGSLWVVGYVVAPTLFSMLEREHAGEVAGQLFTYVAWMVIATSVLILVVERLALRSAPLWARACLWSILLLSLAAHFGMRPHIAGLKAAQAAAQIGADEYRSAFGRAHGISALLFLVQSLLAAVLVAAWRR